MAIDLTGLSGYALEYAKAANKGASYDEASRAATKAIGGSGLYKADIDRMSGSGLDTSKVTYKKNGMARNQYDDDEDDREEVRKELSRTSSNRSSSSDDIYDLIKEMTGKNEFEAPDEATMKGWAKAYANTTVNPMVAAINASLNKQLSAQENARGEVEAAYAGLPAQFQSRLDEARDYSLRDAISRGAGRTGVVNWETEKRTTPIMQEQAQADREKSAKIAAIANAIALAQSTSADSIRAAEEQRAALEAARMGELQQWVAGMKSDAGKSYFSNAVSLADLANRRDNNSSDMIMQLLPLLMGG